MRYLREPIGEHFVQVCTTTPCMLRGSTDILNTVCNELNVKPGGTSKDGKFTVVEVECQGACSNAPMMVVGDDFYVRWPDLLPASVLMPVCRRTSLPSRRSGFWLRSARARSPRLARKATGRRARTVRA